MIFAQYSPIFPSQEAPIYHNMSFFLEIISCEQTYTPDWRVDRCWQSLVFLVFNSDKMVLVLI